MNRFVELRRTGSRELRDELVLDHAPLARSVARRYAGRGESLEDLEQVAMLGLLKAVERFDPQQGSAFSSFAVPTIAGEIKRHFRDHSWATHVPRAIKDLARRVTAANEALTIRLGTPPTAAAIAAELQATLDEVLEAIEAGRSYTTESLDGPPSSQEDTRRATPHEVGADEDSFAVVEGRELVRSLLATLPDRQRMLLQLRFDDHLSQSEIATRLGISQMHVSRLLRSTLERLRGELDGSHPTDDSADTTTTRRTVSPR